MGPHPHIPLQGVSTIYTDIPSYEHPGTVWDLWYSYISVWTGIQCQSLPCCIEGGLGGPLQYPILHIGATWYP